MLTIINIGASDLTPDIGAQIERILGRAQSSATPPAVAAPGPAAALAGERYAGIAFDDTGAPSHHLFLIAAKPADKLSWKAAKDWAGSIGYSLPTRFEAALLYANLRSEFETTGWHWTETQYSEAGAWIQLFGNGNQNYYAQTNECLARAVRRLPL